MKAVNKKVITKMKTFTDMMLNRMLDVECEIKTKSDAGQYVSPILIEENEILQTLCDKLLKYDTFYCNHEKHEY
jgi:hypothetical protein